MNTFEKVYREFDKIKPDQSALNRAIESAEKAQKLRLSDSEMKIYKFDKRKTTASVLAACLMLVFSFTMFFSLYKNPANIMSDTADHSFCIKANASTVPVISDNSDRVIIGAYTGELTGGWAMYENFEKNSELSPTFFQSYCFNSFTIEGEEIERVTLRSNAEGTYFALSPDGYYSSSGSTAKVLSEKDKFTDLKLSNSFFTVQELSEHKDGLSYGDVFCDTFTYTNTENKNSINLNCKIEYVIEGSHKTPELSCLLDKIWLCEEDIVKEKEVGIPSDEKFDKLYLDMSEASLELQQIVLKDATVDVIVEFTDGSFQTKTLKMGLEETEGAGLWLTISE